MSDVAIRPLEERDLDAADHIFRVAFGTFLGAPDPASFFGEIDLIRTRFRAAPANAWAAELDGRVVGSVLAARWGSYGWFGPLTTHPDVWNRGIARELMAPVLESFERWRVTQAGLFTFPDSLKHLGLYQRYGFWPRALTALLSKPVESTRSAEFQTLSGADGGALEQIRELTDAVLPGLDLTSECRSCLDQGLGDVVLTQSGVAVCHVGPGTEAGGETCFVKFGAVRPGPDAGLQFEELLAACESFATARGMKRLTAGVNTGRMDAYRRLLGRGFKATRMGVLMQLRPDGPTYDGPEQYVIDDLR